MHPIVALVRDFYQNPDKYLKQDAEEES